MTTPESTERVPIAREWLSQGLESLIHRNRKENRTTFDIVVVGSGYGGAVAAAGLAGLTRNGRTLSLCVLERGKEFVPGAFPSSITEVPTETRFTLPGRDQAAGTLDGLYDFRLGGDLNVVLANGLGGGSLINAGVMQRPVDAVFDSSWPESLQGGTALQPYYDKAEALLGARHDDTYNTIEAHEKHKSKPLNKFTSISELGGSRFRAAPVTIAMRDDAKSSTGIPLQSCELCGDCASGCNHGAKESLDTNLLAEACSKGAEIYTGASVVRLEKRQQQGGTSWIIRVVHTDRKLRERQGEAFEIHTHHLILAAGSLGSTELLLRSEKRDGLRFSSELGKHFSSNGDMLAAGYDQRLPSNSVSREATALSERHVGPTITGIVDARDPVGRGGIVIEEMAIPAPLQRVFEELVTTSNTLHGLSVFNKGWHRRHAPFEDPFGVNEKAINHSSLYAVMGDDGADGRLRLPKPRIKPGGEMPEEGVVTVDWPGLKEKPLFGKQIEQLETLAANSAVKGRILPNPAWKLLPESMMFFTNNQLGPLVTVHPLGGCAMADDVRHGVVDAFGHVYDGDPRQSREFHDGLLVLDGAIIPTAIGTNPALTITAVALRAVEALRKKLEPDTAEQVKKQLGPRPRYRHLPQTAAREAQQTEAQVIERLSGEVRLRDSDGQAVDAVVEITLVFDPVKVRDLAGLHTGNAKKIPVTLKVTKEAADIPAASSRLRIFRKEVWDRLENEIYRPQTPNELRLRQERVEKLKDDNACFMADLEGSLEVFGRGTSCMPSRILRALLAWLPNRGLRDTWQHFFPLPHEPRAAGGKLLKRVMGSLQLASRAGEKRLLAYSLRIGKKRETHTGEGNPRFQLTGGRIEGHKTLTYGRRANPWRQLTEVRLTRMHGLVRQAGASPILRLDTRFLSRIEVPLLRLTAQQDQVNAWLDLFSLGAYLARMMIGIHLWSFRKPDAPSPEEPRRLPGPITGLPRPGVIEIQVDTIPDDKVSGLHAGEPVVIHLTHYQVRGSSKPPVVMIHGYSASGTSFTHDSIDNNFTGSFWKDGRDVWILDMRTSPGLPSARYPWTFEQVAGVDIPIALDYIRRQYTDGRKVDVLAHCMGAVMFSMAALNPKLIIDTKNRHLRRYFGKACDGDSFKTDFFDERVRAVIFSQVTPTVVFSPDNKLRAFLMQYLKELMPDGYQFRPENPSLADELIDRLLYTLPYPEEEFDIENPPWNPCKRTGFTRTRHRMDALYGRDFNLRNVDDKLLAHIDDLFGPMSIDTVAQTIHFARLDTIATKGGHNPFVTEENLHKWHFPTCGFHGEDNGLADVVTAERTWQIFDNATNAPLLEVKRKQDPQPIRSRYLKLRNSHYGHQDSLIGRSAHAEVFPALKAFLDEVDSIEEKQQGPVMVGSPRMEAPAWSKAVTETPSSTGYEASKGAPVKATRQGKTAPLSGEPISVTRTSAPVALGWRLEKPWYGPVVLPREDDGKRVRILTGSDPVFGAQTAQLLVPLFHGEDETLEMRESHPYQVNMQPIPAGKAGFRIGTPILQEEGVTISEIPLSDLQQGDDFAGLLVLMFYGRIPASIEGIDTAIRNGIDDFLQSEKNPREALIAWRPCAPADELCIAFGSCQYPGGMLDDALAYEAWRSLGEQLSGNDGALKPDMLLLMGDQVYVDATAGLFDPESVEERYEWPYRKLYANPHVRDVLRRLPAYCMLDDHEIDDNWQPHAPAHPDFERNAERARLGVDSYLKYQRGIHPEKWRASRNGKAPLWYDFEHKGFRFFMFDTRTDRAERNAGNIDDDRTTLISQEQLDAFEAWLAGCDAETPAFVVSPSILFPRHLAASGDFPASALRADGWDGYPQSLRKIVQLVAEKRCNHLVFLSGDEHLSCDATIEIRVDGQPVCAIRSIHCSGLYAPLPFANSRPEDLVAEETWCFQAAGVRYCCKITTEFREDIQGFGILHVNRDASRTAELRSTTPASD